MPFCSEHEIYFKLFICWDHSIDLNDNLPFHSRFFLAADVLQRSHLKLSKVIERKPKQFIYLNQFFFLL